MLPKIEFEVEMSTASPLPPNFLLGHYEVHSVLGSGGFGVTYQALDRKLQRFVAIKEYFPRGAAMRNANGGVQVASAAQEVLFRWGLDRFVEEGQTLARFNHPNIVRVTHIFSANGTCYLVLDFVDGNSLQKWIADAAKPPSQDEIDGFTSMLSSALEAVHRNEILHRDIAPKNILLKHDNTPVLIDFGSARQVVYARSAAITAIITPRYAPHEQYITSGQGQGPWTDIYSLAATLYEVVTKSPPPEAPGRTLGADPCVPAAKAAKGQYRRSFLDAIDWGLKPYPCDRPQSVEVWTKELLNGMRDEARTVSLLTEPLPKKDAPRPLMDRIRNVFR